MNIPDELIIQITLLLRELPPYNIPWTLYDIKDIADRRSRLDGKNLYNFLIVSKNINAAIRARWSYIVNQYTFQITDRPGNIRYIFCGTLHREQLPAVILITGTEIWYKYGKKHRIDDNPAVISSFGTKEWWVNGMQHRDHNRPAVIYRNGDSEYWINGKRLRVEEKSFGDMYLYKNARLRK